MTSRGHPRPRVLIVSPAFFGYERAIAEAFDAAGADVRLVDERPSNSAVVRAVARVRPGWLAPWTARHVERASARLGADADLDLVLVVKGETVPPSFLAGLRRDNPRARVVFYAYDPLGDGAGLTRLAPHLDAAYAFDRTDVAAIDGLTYKPLFYAPEFAPGPAHVGRRHPVSFVGTVDPTRFVTTRTLSHRYPDGYFHLYAPARWYVPVRRAVDPAFRDVEARSVSTRKLSRGAVARAFADSRVVVDLPKRGQAGLTMRTFEALASGASLVTSNPYVRDEEFFDEHRIAVVDDRDQDALLAAVESLLDAPTDGSPPPGFARHAVSSWAGELLSSHVRAGEGPGPLPTANGKAR